MSKGYTYVLMCQNVCVYSNLFPYIAKQNKIKTREEPCGTSLVYFLYYENTIQITARTKEYFRPSAAEERSFH